MASNPKPNPVSPDDLIYDELDEANKHNYYKAVEKEIKETAREAEANGEQMVE
jgi:type III secretory pathway component EscR